MLFVNLPEMVTAGARPCLGLHIIFYAANNLQQLRTHHLSTAGPAVLSWVEDNCSLKYQERGREKLNSIPFVEDRGGGRTEF